MGLVRIYTAPSLREDLITWLSKVCDDGYGKHFTHMSEEDRDAILSDFLASAPGRIEDGIFTLTLREKYQIVRVAYHDFTLERRHFNIEVEDPFTGQVIDLNACVTGVKKKEGNIK